MAYVEYTLRNYTKKSQEAYRLYRDRLELKLAQQKAVAKRKLKAAEADLKKYQTEYSRYQNFQVDHPDDYKKHHDGKLEYYGNLVSITKHNVQANRDELKALDTQLPTQQQFNELTDSYLETLLKTKDLMEIDIICNEVVSNLRVGNDAVSVIKLNPPYDLMVDLSKVSTGRG